VRKAPVRKVPVRKVPVRKAPVRKAPVRKARREPADAEITIGVDVGTTAVKAIAVDGRGRVRGRARVAHEVCVADPDSFEHDAAAAWYEGPQRAVAALGPAASPAAGLGIAACVPSLVALGDHLEPLSPGLLYGDWRGRAAAAAWPPASPLDIREGEAFLHWAAKQWPGARAYWPAQALAAVALGGEPVIDSFTAMSYFPIFDGRHWDPAELSRIGVTEDQLPIVVTEIGATARSLGGLTRGSARSNGDADRAGRTSLAPGGVDVMTEQITAGVSQPGEAHIMCGTTLLTWAVMPDDGDVPGLWRFPHRRPGLCLLGGPSNAGGLFLGWARRLLGGTRARTARRSGLGPGIDPHPDRIPLWTPYVRGERIPLHNTSVRGSLHGLDLMHDATALRRAAYEATGFVARRILDMAGCSPSQVVATGGGTKDRAWMQALADCTGVPVIRAAVPEGAALGMAWMARIAAGLESSLDDAARWSRPGRPVYPDERWARACSRRYEQFRELAAAVRTY